MYDAMSVLMEAFGKMLRKKPDLLRSPSSSSSSSAAANNHGYLPGRTNGTTREVHCGTGPDFKDPVIPFEVGEKIAKHIRKVGLQYHSTLGIVLYLMCFWTYLRYVHVYI